MFIIPLKISFNVNFSNKLSIGRRVDITMAITRLLEEMKDLNDKTVDENKFLYVDFSVRQLK